MCESSELYERRTYDGVIQGKAGGHCDHRGLHVYANIRLRRRGGGGRV